VAGLTLDALEAHSPANLSNYARALREATAATNPAYGLAWYGDRYRDVAGDPDWFIGSLVDNAWVEGEGARKLWILSARCADAAISQQIRRHAIDESRHAQYYVRMVDVLFPNSISDQLRPELAALSPRYLPTSAPPAGLPAKTSEQLIDDLVQLNIGEIRTHINQLLLRPVAHAYCLDHDALQRILHRLMRDETRHIHYTARILEQFARRGRGALVHDLFCSHMDDFNTVTLREVGEDQFDGS
jgi:hypothetical protein